MRSPSRSASGSGALLHQRRRDVHLQQRQHTTSPIRFWSTGSNTRPRSDSRSTSNRSRSRRSRPTPFTGGAPFLQALRRRRFRRLRDRALSGLLLRPDRRHGDRRRDAVLRPRLDGGRSGPAPRREAHRRQNRACAARHRHAPQHLSRRPACTRCSISGCGLPAGGAFSTNGVVGSVVDDEPGSSIFPARSRRICKARSFWFK